MLSVNYISVKLGGKELCLQKQTTSHVWRVGHSLPTPALDLGNTTVIKTDKIAVLVECTIWWRSWTYNWINKDNMMI